MRLSRYELRDHINYRKNDRWPSYRFYRALQRLKSPMRYICEILEPRDFRVFQHNLPITGLHPTKFSPLSAQEPSIEDVECEFGFHPAKQRR